MTEPINISRQNVEGKCELKCIYNFEYKNTVGTAINGGSVIFVRPEERSEFPVTYNKEKYRLFQILIYYPSNILYNNRQADAELRVVHLSEKGNRMIVFIPMRVSSETNTASTFVSTVIGQVSSSAPSHGGTVNIGVFNLQDVIPKKPFYACKGANNAECVCFGLLDAIPISSTNLDTLKKVITPFAGSVFIEEPLFYNSSGPNSTTVGDGIYISCIPTGSSEETTEVVYETDSASSSLITFEDLRPYLQFIFTVFVVVIVVYLVGKMFGVVGKKTSSSVDKFIE